MKIGLNLNYLQGDFRDTADRLVDLEQAGLDAVSLGEAYSFDAASRLGYIAARTRTLEIASGIFPVYTRTPSLTAMTAAGLDDVSGGRFTLGIGASGPQVIEGFHGVRYDAPLGHAREVIEVCRAVWRREKVVHAGQHYAIPLPVEHGTGLGKPLKLINHPIRMRIPVLLAAIGPRNVELAAELAEKWEPIFFHPGRASQVWDHALSAGKAKRDPALGELEICVSVPCAVGAGAERSCERVREQLALYIGGMGSKGRNFYAQLAERYGYGEHVGDIQELFLAGRKEEATDRIPEELARAISLIGTDGEIRDQVREFAQAGVTQLNIQPLTENHEQLRSTLETLKSAAEGIRP